MRKVSVGRVLSEKSEERKILFIFTDNVECVRVVNIRYIFAHFLAKKMMNSFGHIRDMLQPKSAKSQFTATVIKPQILGFQSSLFCCLHQSLSSSKINHNSQF